MVLYSLGLEAKSILEELRLYFIAVVLGLATCLVVWYISSIAIAHSITWTETRHPQLAGSTRVRVGEILACGVAFAGSILIGFWIASLLTERIK